MPDTKFCTVCEETKPVSEFGVHSRTRDGLRRDCKSCAREYARLYYQKDPARVKERKLLALYGISLKEYEDLLELQDYSCLICERQLVEGDKIAKPNVDHNHDTGSVRGILCNQCNVALGLLQDNPDLLRRAARYLETDGKEVL